MQFLYPALTAGFLLGLAPILIHLINMMRHRRVRWAAMDFLLQSYKRHRKWIWLKQLLLLLMRIAAMVLIVAMLAQLVTQRRYEGFFGNTLTHHYVLVDDSFSMSDRAGGSTAFDRGLDFVRQLAATAAQQELPQRFTLIRFSRAAAAANIDADAAQLPQVAELNAEMVDTAFAVRLEEARRSMEVTQLSVGPEAALRVARRLMRQQKNENRRLYLVSDFRKKEWDAPGELRQLLGDMEQDGAELHLVNCVRTRRGNLAITRIAPAEETRAAGVPLFVNVSVTNYGDQAQEKIPLKVRTQFFASESQSSGQPKGKPDRLPVLQIDRIEPGRTVTARVQVYFPEAGRHIVEAALPEDAVPADNRRWCVVDFPQAEQVLVIDGDPDQRNAFYAGAIFDPGQRARTGVRADVRDTAFLRDISADALDIYSAIYLMDVGRMDDRAVTNLESYVKAGGGLAWFVGPQVNRDFYNQRLVGNGQGLFPVELDRDEFLEPDPLDDAPDVIVEIPGHPVFRELVQGQNPIVRMVHVEHYLQAPRGWTPPTDSTVRVVARLRNRAPLVLEKSLGDGRVIAFLTSYAPYWNDIALGPGVLLSLRLQSYLGSRHRTDVSYLVGDSIDLRLDGETYRQDVKIFAPSRNPAAPVIRERPARKQATDSRVFVAELAADETERSGVYEMWLNQVDGTLDARRFAVNVDAREGDLGQTVTATLLSKLDPVNVDLRFVDQYESSVFEQAGFNQSMLLLVLLVLLLFAEQVVAYITSFHPARRAEPARGARR